MTNILRILCLLVLPSLALAQDDLLTDLAGKEKKPLVVGTFNSIYLVNTPTSETVDRGGDILLNFMHRFSPITGPLGGPESLYGLDNVSDYRLEFAMGITERLMLGIARSKLDGRFDLNGRYKILQQRQDGFPFTLTFVGNIAYATARNTGNAGNQTYPTQTSRLSYLAQAVFAKKMGPFSLALTPMYLRRNYVLNSLDEFNIFALAVATRLKLTGHISITADYVHNSSNFRLYKAGGPYFPPIGTGVEIGVGGHIFQLYMTNVAALPNEYLLNSANDWAEARMTLGFSIVRNIGLKRRQKAASPETGN